MTLGAMSTGIGALCRMSSRPWMRPLVPPITLNEGLSAPRTLRALWHTTDTISPADFPPAQRDVTAHCSPTPRVPQDLPQALFVSTLCRKLVLGKNPRHHPRQRRRERPLEAHDGRLAWSAVTRRRGRGTIVLNGPCRNLSRSKSPRAGECSHTTRIRRPFCSEASLR